MSTKSLSVVVPFFNEEDNLQKLHHELTEVMDELKLDGEIIYVDDGSTDSSASVLKDAVKKGNSGKVRVKVITFRKNFGQTAAISAGIDNSSGDLISFLDADLQNDPRDIPRFIERIDEGYDAVFGWRNNLC